MLDKQAPTHTAIYQSHLDKNYVPTAVDNHPRLYDNNDSTVLMTTECYEGVYSRNDSVQLHVLYCYLATHWLNCYICY